MSDPWRRRLATLRGRFGSAATEPADRKPLVATLPLADVRHMCDLPPFPLQDVLGPECWMAGGRIVRWFRDGSDTRGGDFDLCFPSLEAVRVALRGLLMQGFRLKGLRAWRERICFRCGSRVGAIDHHLIQRCLLAAVELVSPQGQLVQLSTSHLYPTPEELVLDVDLTICQLATDGQHLYYSATALYDLSRERFGLGCINYPPLTLLRIFKYGCRGFRPRGDVWAKVLAAWWHWRRRRRRPPRRGP